MKGPTISSKCRNSSESIDPLRAFIALIEPSIHKSVDVVDERGIARCQHHGLRSGRLANMTRLGRSSNTYLHMGGVGGHRGRRMRWRIALVTVAGLGSVFATGLSASTFAEVAPATTFAEDQRPGALVPFVEDGVPVGQTSGVPSDLTLDAGFTLKHVHGGPTYVYVVSGNFDITDGDGTTVTYHKGDFFSEPAGHIHTIG